MALAKLLNNHRVMVNNNIRRGMCVCACVCVCVCVCTRDGPEAGDAKISRSETPDERNIVALFHR